MTRVDYGATTICISDKNSDTVDLYVKNTGKGKTKQAYLRYCLLNKGTSRNLPVVHKEYRKFVNFDDMSKVHGINVPKEIIPDDFFECYGYDMKFRRFTMKRYQMLDDDMVMLCNRNLDNVFNLLCDLFDGMDLDLVGHCTFDTLRNQSKSKQLRPLFRELVYAANYIGSCGLCGIIDFKPFNLGIQGRTLILVDPIL